MKIKQLWIALVLLALATGCKEQALSSADTQPAADRTNRSAVVDADNSGRNVRDAEDTLTPGDQGESEADRKTTQAIRKALVIDAGDYSTTAKNIKIITVQGKVTLRGPVKSEAEKTAIAALANGIAGQGNLDNQLEVKANP